MAKHTVVTMPGDGIGNQVLPEALRVLDAVGFDAEYVHADIGWDCWCREGNALPQRTIDLLAKHKLGLFGAITSKPKKQAEAELAPELRGKGYSYFSPIVTMRQRFNLDTCIRPCISFPGNPLNFVRKNARRRLRGTVRQCRRLPAEHRRPLRRSGMDQSARTSARRARHVIQIQALCSVLPEPIWPFRCASSRDQRRAKSARRLSIGRKSMATNR